MGDRGGERHEVHADPLLLVPGELRGYRRFLLLDDGLYPISYRSTGRWDAGRQVARCAVGGAHSAPDRDCTCGLYGWYESSATARQHGSTIAVVAASGRIVLGDRGFRAARSRVEAVALAFDVRCAPSHAARARRMLSELYPDVRVYDSARAMFRDYPPHDVRELGIDRIDRSPERFRRAAYALWAMLILAGYVVLLVRREPVADTAATWWLVWLMVWLIGWRWTLVVVEILSQPKPSTFTGPDIGGR